MKHAWFLTWALFSSVAPALADDFRVPELSGPVVDEAGLLSAADRDRLSGALTQIDRQGRAQIAVLIPKSLQGLEIEDYSIRIVEAWKLGEKGKDNGVLLVIAPEERRMRIEVGYGWEGEITDAFSRQVLDDVIRPHFRDGRYAEGISAGLGAIVKKMGLNSPDLPAPQTSSRSRSRDSGVGGKLFWLVIVLGALGGTLIWLLGGAGIGAVLSLFVGGKILVGAAVGGVLGFLGGLFFRATRGGPAILARPASRRSGSGSWWGSGGGGGWGGGSGGGGFSGGGGGFGGGGSSSSW